VLDRKFDAKHFESGFAQRVLMVEPPPRQRVWNDTSVTDDVEAGYFNLVNSLYGLPMTEQVEKDSDGDSVTVKRPNVVELSDDAKKLFIKAYGQHGSILDKLPDGPFLSFYAKVMSIVAKLALILHLCDVVDSRSGTGKESVQPVSGNAMKRAVVFTKWFIHETHRIYQAHDFQSLVLSKDELLVLRLPTPCTWDNIAEVWSVERSQAFDIQKQLLKKGLLLKKKGLYVPQYSTGLPDFPDS